MVRGGGWGVGGKGMRIPEFQFLCSIQGTPRWLRSHVLPLGARPKPQAQTHICPSWATAGWGGRLWAGAFTRKEPHHPPPKTCLEFFSRSQYRLCLL